MRTKAELQPPLSEAAMTEERVLKMRELALWSRDTLGARGMDGISAVNLCEDVILLANLWLAQNAPGSVVGLNSAGDES